MEKHGGRDLFKITWKSVAEPEIIPVYKVSESTNKFKGPNQSDLQPPPSAHGQESH